MPGSLSRLHALFFPWPDKKLRYCDMRLLLEPYVLPGDACSWIEWDRTDSRPGTHHAHRFREVFWVLEGQGSHSVSGRSFPLSSQLLVLVHEDDLHEMRPSPGHHLRFVNLAFDRKTSRSVVRRYAVPDPFDLPLEERHIHLDSDRWMQFKHFGYELQTGRRGRGALERFLLNLLYLLRQPEQPPDSCGAPVWLQEAMLHLQVAPGDLSLGRFVDLCGRSREHVTRVCRGHLGRSPTELLNDVRLSHASVALAQSDKKVIDIAHQSGFGHLGHFYREFQRRYGMTPRRYRLRAQGIARA